MPPETIKIIRNMSEAYASLPERLLIPEQAQVLKRIKYDMSRHPWLNPVLFAGNANTFEFLSTGKVSGQVPTDYREFLNMGDRGFPQGASISPILSNLALEPSLFTL